MNVDYLKVNLPKGQMVMLQEETHTGKSYLINSVFLAVESEREDLIKWYEKLGYHYLVTDDGYTETMKCARKDQ